MAIKQMTLSALTGGVLVLAYAAWSKWRSGPQLREAQAPELEHHHVDLKPADLEREAELDAGEQIRSATGLEVDALELPFDEIWDSSEVTANPHEQLVDFSSEVDYDEEEGPVAPEDLGVRWLTRATEAMSPSGHGLALRQEADVANVEPPAQPDEAVSGHR